MTDDLPSLDELRVRLLDSLLHEDDQGLWEIVWGLNADMPGVSVDAKLALARKLIFGLVDEGVVALRTSRWPQRADAGRSLTSAEFGRLQHEDAPWIDPERAADLVVWVVPAART